MYLYIYFFIYKMWFNFFILLYLTSRYQLIVELHSAQVSPLFIAHFAVGKHIHVPYDSCGAKWIFCSACIMHYKCANIFAGLTNTSGWPISIWTHIRPYWFCGPPEIRLIVPELGRSLLRAKLAPNRSPQPISQTHKNWPKMGELHMYSICGTQSPSNVEHIVALLLLAGVRFLFICLFDWFAVVYFDFRLKCRVGGGGSLSISTLIVLSQQEFDFLSGSVCLCCSRLVLTNSQMAKVMPALATSSSGPG